MTEEWACRCCRTDKETIQHFAECPTLTGSAASGGPYATKSLTFSATDFTLKSVAAVGGRVRGTHRRNNRTRAQGRSLRRPRYWCRALPSPPASSEPLGVFGRGSCPSRAPSLSSAGWALQRRLGDARRGLFLRPDWWERPRIERDLMKPPARPSPSSLAERGRWRGSGDPLQLTALTRSASLATAL